MNLPDWLTYVILGVIQGLTEFLPVSSSGHLVLAEKILGFREESVAFEILLHLATLAAVLWVYRIDVGRMIGSTINIRERGPVAVRDRALLMWIILGTLPVVAIVLLPAKDIIPLKEFAENLKNQPYAVPVVAGALFFSGLLMFVLDRLRSDDVASYERKGWRSIFIGIAQCIALIPGVSRSGSTIFTGVLLGLGRKDAARYSFLLSIPAILGAVVLSLDDIHMLVGMATLPVLLGIAAAFISGVIAINWLIDMLLKLRAFIFSIWCWLVAAVSLALYFLS
ncbi:undecaprenyl-diphosphate phosphatase [bacterium]|nr:undecaprenyl-diphosphate phosphatase [bacterium]